MFADHFYIMLAELWVGSLYAVLQSVVSRRLTSDPEVLSLHRDLSFLRTGLEKHEVPKDKAIKKKLGADKLSFRPFGAPAETAATYDYVGNDPMRSHIVPKQVTLDGILGWHVLDLEAQKDYWVYRLHLADRFLALPGVIAR